MAKRTRLQRGANAEDLERGKPKRRDSDGNIYNANSMLAGRNKFRTDAKKLAQQGSEYLEVMIEAAGEDRAAVYSSFVEWLEATRKDFGLASLIDAALRRLHKKPKSIQSPVSLLRKDTQLARDWGYKDNAKLSDDQIVTLTQGMWPIWAPAGFGGLSS